MRQNCVKMVPGDSQNGSSSESNALEATKWHEMAPGSGFCRCPPSLLELSGDPEGLRKSIKNRLFAKKCVPDVLFLTFYVQISVLPVFLGFCIDFSQKINENVMKTSRYIFTPSLALLNMATLTKHRILRYESHFFCVILHFPSPKTSNK